MHGRRWLLAVFLSLLVGSAIWLMVSPGKSDTADRQPLYARGDSPPRPITGPEVQADPRSDHPALSASRDPAPTATPSLEQQMACFERGDCGAPSTDSRADHQREAEAIVRELSQLDGRAPEARAQALRALRLPNGHVQRAALDVIMQQAPDAQSADAVAQAIAQSHDAPLFEHAADWLAEAVQTGHVAPVERMLGESILHGSPFLAQSMADQLLRFLTEDNRLLFAEIEQQLPAHSLRALRLRQALQEFDLQQRGG